MSVNIVKTKQKVVTIQNLDLTFEDIQKAVTLANTINLDDESSITNFGINTQKKLGDSSTKILNEVKTKDTEEIGMLLGTLLNEVKSYDVTQTGFEKLMSNLPIVGKFYQLGDKILSQHKTVESNLNDITERLDKSRVSLTVDNMNLSKMYDEIIVFIKENKVNIEALRIKVRELSEDVVPQLQSELQAKPDQIKEQELSRVIGLIARIEKKIYSMDLFQTASEQSMPRLMLMADNNLQLSSNIESTILNVIPLWKQQIAEALYLEKQKKVVDLQDAIYNTTNDLIRKNSKTIKDNTIKVAKHMERGVIDIETLKQVNSDFVETIKEVKAAREQGVLARQKATAELQQVKSDMSKTIASLNATNEKSVNLVEAHFEEAPKVETLISEN
jgi:uncharacterized protein YaaN involved in tellurite resistance